MKLGDCATWDGGKTTWGGWVEAMGTVPVCVYAQESWGEGRVDLAGKKGDCATWDGGKTTWGGWVEAMGTVPVCVYAQESWGEGRVDLAGKKASTPKLTVERLRGLIQMIPEPSDAEHEVLVYETFHEQTDDELTENELKQVKTDICIWLEAMVGISLDSMLGRMLGIRIGIANHNQNRNGNIVAARAKGNDGDMCMYALTVSIMEPKNVKEAMTDPAWIESMQEELLHFKRLDVWVLVLAADNIKPLTLKWLFKNNHDEDNTVMQDKTRLVVRGYRQKEGIYFKGSFAPVAKAIDRISAEGPCLGLELNIKKTEGFWPSCNGVKVNDRLFPCDIGRPALGVKLLGGTVSQDAGFISSLAMKRASRAGCGIDGADFDYGYALDRVHMSLPEFDLSGFSNKDTAPPKAHNVLVCALFSEIVKSLEASFDLSPSQKVVVECLQAPRAQNILTIIPIEGLRQYMSALEYETIYMYRLMNHLFPIDEPYLLCRKIYLDSFGEHAVNCKELPGFKYRHDWDNRFVAGQAALKLESNKVTKHEKACLENQHVFIPFAFDTFSFLAPEAEEFFTRVQRVVQSNLSTPMTQNFIFSRIGFAVQKGLRHSLMLVYPPSYCKR
nr:auxilin-like protein [Tanacetum cinerariifolium]